MEAYEVRKLKEPVDWTVSVPGSKSITNRALLMAALASGSTRLNGVLFSDDSRYFLSSLKSLGYKIETDVKKHTVLIVGNAGSVPAKNGTIDVGSAGTAARFLTAMLGVSEGIFVIKCSDQMRARPMKPLFEALIKLGAGIEWLGEEWHLPARITGSGGETGKKAVLSLDISRSTQFLSAFLLISPMFKGGLRIDISSEKKDGSYVRITRRMMEQGGVSCAFDGCSYETKPGIFYSMDGYEVEPDVSAACYFYAAAALSGGRAKVAGIHSDGMQGDLKFLNVLRKMGCVIYEDPDGIAVEGPKSGKLRGISVDMNDFSDQALTLAAIAPYASSPVEIYNIGHIRGQECDRLNAISFNLSRAGIKCEEREDAVTIFPGKPSPCSIKTFSDHRVAMAFSVMGLGSAGIVIEDPLCCKKTFGEYFDILDTLTK